MSETLLIIKPGALAKGLTEDILSVVMNNGFKITRTKHVIATQEQAESHYAEHNGKPWFKKITTALCSGPIMCAIVYSDEDDVVDRLRTLQGATDPKNAAPGTLRALFGACMDDNATHASDSTESAAREIAIWFTK